MAQNEEIIKKDAKKGSKRIIKIAIIATPIVVAVIAFLIVLSSVIMPNAKYNNAITLMNTGRYSEAVDAFKALDGYKDSESKITECQYGEAIALMNTGKYSDAINVFEALEGYKDSKSRVTECKYYDAVALMDAGKYTEAINAFEALGDYKESLSKLGKCKTIEAYNNAVALMDTGKYGEAIEAFTALYGFKDSESRLTECKYNEAIALMDAGKYSEAMEAFIALDEYKDSKNKITECKSGYKKEQFKNPKVGDYVFFGAYEQDNDTSNGKEDVEWLILDVKDGKALVISKNCIDYQLYHNQPFDNDNLPDITWEECSLRTWLNETFLNSAFSADEQEKIAMTNVSADKNPKYELNPGNATNDKVFLLSITEAEKYFTSDSERRSNDEWWWLRSRGASKADAAYVDSFGSIDYSGHISNYKFYIKGVRPVFWINLD